MTPPRRYDTKHMFSYANPMAETVAAHPKTKKPWYMKWWVWLIAAIVVIGGIGNLVNPAPKIEVPDLLGKPAAEATDELRELGFTVTLKNGDQSVFQGDDYDVESSDPAAGSEAREGSKITLYVVEATERLAAEAAEAERVKLEEQAKKEAELAAQKEANEAKAAEYAAAPVSQEVSQMLCDLYAENEFPYGVKMHWIMERYADTQTESGWFLKVGATVTNAFNAERKYNVECHVSGTNGAPVMDDFLYY